MKSWIRAGAFVAAMMPFAAGAQTAGQGGAGRGGATPSDRAAPTPRPRPTSDSLRPLPFAGSSLSLDHSVSAETFSNCVQRYPNGECSAYNPSFQTWASLRPRWSIVRGVSVRARQDLTIEWTSSDTSTLVRQAEFGDLWLDLAFTGLPRLAGISTTLGVRTQWPVSLTSRSVGRILNASLFAVLARSWDTIPFGNSFSLSVFVATAHAFNSAPSGGGVALDPIPTGASASPSGMQPIRGFPCQIASDYNTRAICAPSTNNRQPVFVLTALLGVGYSPVQRVDIGLSLISIWSILPPVTPATIRDQMGGTTIVEPSGNDPGFRQATWFSANVDYEVSRWFSASLGYYAFAPVLGPAGQYYNPFWSPGNGRLFVTATFALDRIYEAITGRVPPPAGGAGAGSRVVYNEAAPRSPTRRSAMNDAARRIREEQFSNGAF